MTDPTLTYFLHTVLIWIACCCIMSTAFLIGIYYCLREIIKLINAATDSEMDS